MISYSFSPLKFSELDKFFEGFDFSEDEAHTRQYLSIIQESVYCQQVIVHEAHSIADEDAFGFVTLGMTHSNVDDVPGLLVEL